MLTIQFDKSALGKTLKASALGIRGSERPAVSTSRGLSTLNECPMNGMDDPFRVAVLVFSSVNP